MTYLLFSTYFGIALLVLCLLALAILRIGEMLPGAAPCTRVAAMTIATGFAAIGLGAIIAVAAAIAMSDVSLVIFLAATGGITVALGLGFSNAVTTMRAVLAKQAQS